jgi:hypothetical protein
MMKQSLLSSKKCLRTPQNKRRFSIPPGSLSEGFLSCFLAFLFFIEFAASLDRNFDSDSDSNIQMSEGKSRIILVFNI